MAASHDLFVFGIPLIPKRRANNWQRVLDNLQATLQSILNQTDQNFLVMIATEDAIDLPEINHGRIKIAPVPPQFTSEFSLDERLNSERDAGGKRYF